MTCTVTDLLNRCSRKGSCVAFLFLTRTVRGLVRGGPPQELLVTVRPLRACGPRRLLPGDGGLSHRSAAGRPGGAGVLTFQPQGHPLPEATGRGGQCVSQTCPGRGRASRAGSEGQAEPGRPGGGLEDTAGGHGVPVCTPFLRLL